MQYLDLRMCHCIRSYMTVQSYAKANANVKEKGRKNVLRQIDLNDKVWGIWRVIRDVR